eukprot:TRINITY_DN121594_c0_g1_i1.p1 TRINITY_DN121594_c0_g1~~TRINITY_DN121594_c0_g1_i1.p1  ORF type:complete len:449 (-),score=31.02 TRINITY_DN121594_c0_g1_i1:143-1429(-)
MAGLCKLRFAAAEYVSASTPLRLRSIYRTRRYMFENVAKAGIESASEKVTKHLQATIKDTATQAVNDFKRTIETESAAMRQDVRAGLADLGPQGERLVDHFCDRMEKHSTALVTQVFDEVKDLQVTVGRASESNAVFSSCTQLDDEALELRVRDVLKSFGADNIGVLERCRLGDRGIYASFPGGYAMQVWFKAGELLGVWPNLPKLTALLQEQRSGVAEMLLSECDASPGAFFLHGDPKCVGYKMPIPRRTLESELARDHLSALVDARELHFDNVHLRCSRLPLPEASDNGNRIGASVQVGPIQASKRRPSETPAQRARRLSIEAQEAAARKDRDIAERWWERTLETYLEPAARSSTKHNIVRQWHSPWVQDTANRRVGLEAVKAMGMDFSHFCSRQEDYVAVAKEAGFDMDIDGPDFYRDYRLHIRW